jgi:hypothetical protein
MGRQGPIDGAAAPGEEDAMAPKKPATRPAAVDPKKAGTVKGGRTPSPGPIPVPYPNTSAPAQEGAPTA